jgi:hypothetical protein
LEQSTILTIGKLLMRHFPKAYTYNSVYALFPFTTPAVNKQILIEVLAGHLGERGTVDVRERVRVGEDPLSLLVRLDLDPARRPPRLPLAVDVAQVVRELQQGHRRHVLLGPVVDAGP